MATCLPVGQIELYTHHPFLPTLVRNLQRLGMRTSAVYLLESQFMEDKYKFFRYVSDGFSHLACTAFGTCSSPLDGRNSCRRYPLWDAHFFSSRRHRRFFSRPCHANTSSTLCPNSANP